MRFAVVDPATGVVENVIEAEPDFDLPGRTLIRSDEAGIGWTWTGGEFAAPPPPPPPVPAAITRRQLRLWLVRHDITLAQVEAAIAALPEPQRTEALIEWQDATQYERAHPLLALLAGAVLGLEGAALDEALDQAFRQAAAY